MGTEATLACPQAVEMRIAFGGNCIVCVKRLLTTATTRPRQSSTGAPDAPWSSTRRSSPSYISSSAVPASLSPSPYATKRPPGEAQTMAGMGKTDEAVAGGERLDLDPQALRAGKRRLQFEQGNLSRMRARHAHDADGNGSPALTAGHFDPPPTP